MGPVTAEQGSARTSFIVVAVLALALAGVAAMASPALAVGTAKAKITTDVHNADHVDISTTVVPAGTEVHLRIALASSRGQALPTGTVDFNRYVNLTCTGTPVATETDVAIVNGVAESSPYATTGEAFSLRAQYDGDSIYNTGSSLCEVMNAGVITITLAIHDINHNDVTGTTLPVGTTIHVLATLTSSGANQPTGTVEFKFWNGPSDCPGHANSTEKRAMIVSGQVESRPYTMQTAGAYSYNLLFRGDANHTSAVGPCVFVNAG